MDLAKVDKINKYNWINLLRSIKSGRIKKVGLFKDFQLINLKICFRHLLKIWHMKLLVV